MTDFLFPAIETGVVHGLDANQTILAADWVSMAIAPAGGVGTEAVFQHCGSEAHKQDAPAIRVGIYTDAKANGGLGKTNVSFKLSIPMYAEGDDLERPYPATATLAWSVPGTVPAPDTTDLRTLLVTLFNAVVPVESSHFSSDILNVVAFGVPMIYNESA